MNHRPLLPLALLGLLAPALPPLVGQGPDGPSAQEASPAQAPEGARTASTILQRLARVHYQRQPVDDVLSGRIFDQYLEYLDSTRSLFLESDVDEFERWRGELDDLLKEGDLGPAYAIFERFQERRTQRQEYLIERVEAGLETLDLSDDEELLIDRRTAVRPADRAALEDLWRRQLENDVLGLVLKGSSREEAAERLGKRYHNQMTLIEKTTPRDVLDVFMTALTQSFDPHTQFFPRQVAEDFDIQMSLSLEGIGALLGSEAGLTRVERLIPGGPAEKDGRLEPGDRIVAVGQGPADAPESEMVDVVGWRVREVVDLVRGEKGSVVRLAVLSKGEPDSGMPRVISIVRDEVKLEEQAAQSEVLEIEHAGETRTVGVIDLSAFYMDFEAYGQGDASFKSSTRDVEVLLRELAAKSVDAVVLDLRGNGGGSLTEAQGIAGLFLGPRPVVQVRDTYGRIEILPATRPTIWSGPLVVLIDRLSASASEIFAGAIQDYGRGVLVGNRTFGKGTVQGISPLEDGELKVTQAMFFRVSGESTQHRGVIPDLTLPGAYDEEELGESALETSLPWDRIRALEVDVDRSLTKLLPILERRHELRAVDDPDLARVIERLEWVDEARERRAVSLQESARRAQDEADDARLLAIENRWRETTGREPLTSLEELEREDAADRPLAEDPFIREAAHVAADLAELASKQPAFVSRDR